MFLCSHRLTVRTLGFHPKNRSSILRGNTIAQGGGSWSARQAHNLEIVGSNPAPATKTLMSD